MDTSLFLLSTLCVKIFSRQGGRQHCEKWKGKHNVLHRAPVSGMKNAGRAERGAACVSLAGSPLGLIDISLTKVKYNSLVFINMRKGPGNQTHHLVKTTV